MGGGGNSTTSAEIAPEWKPYINQVVQNAGGVMGALPLLGTGTGGAGGGGAGGMGPTITLPNGTTIPNPLYQGGGADQGGGEGGPQPGSQTHIPGQGDFIPDRYRNDYDPSEGAYAYRPREIVGASGLEEKAAAGVEKIRQQPDAAVKAKGLYQGSAVEGQDAQSARASLDRAGQGVSSVGLAGNEALNEANSIFEKYLRPSVLNQSSLSGHSAGSAIEGALGRAKASYLMPTIFKSWDVAGADRNRDVAVGQAQAGMEGQRAGIEQGAASGLRGIAQDTTARRAGYVDAASRIGEKGRGIAQAGADADEQERQRLIQAATQTGLGPLASMLPAFMGSSTTTSQNKI